MSYSYLEFFDLFSPPITLFYDNRKKHSRLSSLILNILGILALVSSLLYYFILMITRQKFTAYAYDSYVKVAPEVKGDKTGFFHYYILNGIEPNDKYITVVGYDNDRNYSYIYGKCSEENMKDIENLIIDKIEFLNYGYCIKKSVKLSDGYITLVNDKNFVWPVIAEGGNFYYYFEVTKCSTTSNLPTGEIKECVSQKDINDYFENLQYGTLFILNNYIDVGIYKNPVTSYFYAINMQLGLQTYTNNHINYNPAVINSHQDLFKDKTTKTNTIIFSRIDASFEEKIEGQTDTMIAAIFFWRSSKMIVYERKYDGLSNFLINIGGIYQVIMRIGTLIGTFFSGYAELIDSKILYNEIKNNIKENSKSKNNENKIIKFQKINSVSQNYKYILKTNEKRKFSPDKKLIMKNLDHKMKNININNAKNIHIDDNNTGFFKYLYYLFFGCFYDNKEIFKYLDIRKKVLSEEFLYEFYFEKYNENFTLNSVNESKENLIIIPDIENMRNFDNLQKIEINRP